MQLSASKVILKFVSENSSVTPTLMCDTIDFLYNRPEIIGKCLTTPDSAIDSQYRGRDGMSKVGGRLGV